MALNRDLVYAHERTREVYEQIAGFPKPPMIPLPEPEDLESLEKMGVQLGTVSRRIIKAAMFVTGFQSFQRQLPNNLETLLRQSDLRGGGLFAPVISATLALEDDPRNLSPSDRAAMLLFAARRLYDDIISGRLEPDRYRGQVLEMGQYPNFFSTCLILEGKVPRIFKSTKVSQITVVVARRLYILQVGNLGVETTIEQVKEAFVEIIRGADQKRLKEQEPCPGLLTCAANATQRKAFYRLQKNPSNTESLAALRHSFLTLCFDLDSHPSSYAEAAFIAHSGNCANRWFHSSLQLVIFGNAKACAICNFSTYLDGNTMMRGVAEMQKRAAQCPTINSTTGGGVRLPPATELKWKIGKPIILRAQKDLQAIIDNQQATFEIPNFGIDFFSAYNLDAVPTFIVALVMAAKRFTDDMVKITQFLTMSKYRCMDLVTAMVTTPEVKQFVDYMDSSEVQKERARALLQEAINSQIRETRKARRYLPLPVILDLFMYSRKGAQRRVVSFIFILTGILLRRLGCLKLEQREVVVSHPEIYPEVPVVGRPGVRLPYLKYFGLHYQIVQDKIVITMMPSVNWTIPNVELIAVLRESLERIKSILRGEN